MTHSPGIVHYKLATLHAPCIERGTGNTITARPLAWGHARAIARALPGTVVRRASGAGWLVTVKIKKF